MLDFKKKFSLPVICSSFQNVKHFIPEVHYSDVSGDEDKHESYMLDYIIV